MTHSSSVDSMPHHELAGPIVATRGLTKHYRDKDILTGVDVDIARNSITGLLGRNGAGKTTLLKIVAGHIRQTSGRVAVLGSEPYDNDAVTSRIAFIRESMSYPDGFRISHALAAARIAYPLWDDAYARTLLDGFELPIDRRIKKLSRGMTSMVGIVIGLASRAPLTLFDEPYLGLDAVARQQFYDLLLADYAVRPRTIVLSTHLIEEIADLLEYVILIDDGRAVVSEDRDRLRDRGHLISGRTSDVGRIVPQRDVLRRETLGGLERVSVDQLDASTRAEAVAAGLDVEPLTLQQLMVALTGRTESPTLEEVAR
ncbi:ATP-binding cassette domain-containing protein [Millisia brevis]|uniref:ATP-binding cassette domain-containing protein n=1 Tax=Millisia brevis TaxID=264148 RepID=UPI001FE1F0CE|nr:ABC transporter ATP-binding protein [Millisia brevis]